MAQKPTSQEKITEMRRLLREGFLTKTAIAKKVKVDYKTLKKHTKDIKEQPTKAQLIKQDVLSKKYTRPEIALRNGISETGLYYYLKRIGVVKQGRPGLTPKQQAEIKKRAELGETYRAIAEDYDRTPECIGTMCRNAGIKRNNNGKSTTTKEMEWKDHKETKRPVRVHCLRCGKVKQKYLNFYEWVDSRKTMYKNCKVHCEVTPTHLDICGIESTFKLVEDFGV